MSELSRAARRARNQLAIRKVLPWVTQGISYGTRLSRSRELAARADRSVFASEDLTRYEMKVFSQNGEDGVVVELLNRIGVGPGFFVEFGIGDGTEGNCVWLADVAGWSGLFLEPDPGAFSALAHKYAGTRVQVLAEPVTPSSLQTQLDRCGVPAEFDLLSIDIDGNDLHVFAAVDRYRPRLVIVEYNASMDRDSVRITPYLDAAWDGTGGFGSSLAAFDEVAGSLGYQLAHTEMSGTNAFYVRSDLAPLVRVASPPRRAANYGLLGGQHPATP